MGGSSEMGPGGVGKLSGLQHIIRLPQPHQPAPVVSGDSVGAGEADSGIRQAEHLRHQRRRHKHCVSPADGRGIIRIAQIVLGIGLGQVKGQGPAGFAHGVQRRHLLGGVIGIRDADILLDIACEHRAGDVEVAAGPEGHGVVAHGQDIIVYRGEIHGLSGGKGLHADRLRQQQNRQDQGCPPLHPGSLLSPFVLYYFITVRPGL